MRDWEKAELEEQIGQAALIIQKLLKCLELVDAPELPEIKLANGWLEDHKSYLPEPRAYDISELDFDEKNLKF